MFDLFIIINYQVLNAVDLFFAEWDLIVTNSFVHRNYRDIMEENNFRFFVMKLWIIHSQTVVPISFAHIIPN